MRGLLSGKNGSCSAVSEKRFYFIISAVLFIISAFSFWEFIYELCHMIGSISCGDAGRALAELIRMFPMTLAAFIFVYMGIYVHHAYMAADIRSRVKTWRVNGLVTIVLGFAVVVSVLGGRIAGTYHSLVEGFISPLFPLDVMFGGLLIAAFGVLSLIYSSELESKGSLIPYHVHRHCGLLRSLGRIPCCLSYLVAVSGFAACFYGTYVMDWTHGYVFYNIMLWLTYACAPAMVIFYRLVWVRADEQKSAGLMKRSGILFFAVNLSILGLYLVSVQLFNEAPDQNSFGILPIEFTASFNAFAPIYGLNNLAAPLTAFVKGSVISRDKK